MTFTQIKSMLFLMLDRAPTMACVGGDHCWLNVLYVVAYCFSWEHVREYLRKFGTHCEINGTPWEHHVHLSKNTMNK
jgi:hypothetical protein